MIYSSHRICIHYSFSILMFSIPTLCSSDFVKFTKHYWIEKENLKHFGENIKGINLVQDEFRVGIINHLPEVKPYLQREVLGRGVRRRKNLEDQFNIEKTTFEASLPHAEKHGDQQNAHAKGKTRSVRNNFVKLSLRKTRSLRKRGVRKRAISEESKGSKEKGHDIVKKSNVKDASSTFQILKRATKCDEKGEEKEDKENDDIEENDGEGDDESGDDIDYDDENNSDSQSTTQQANEKIFITILYPQINVGVNDTITEESSIEKDYDNDTWGSPRNGMDSIKDLKEVKRKQILRTNISILAIWIAGICIVVCILTCGCFYIYVVYLDNDRIDEVQCSIPIK